MYKPVETGVGRIIIIIIIKKRNWDMHLAWMEPRVLGLLLGKEKEKRKKKAESGEKRWPSLIISDLFPFREQQDEKKNQKKQSCTYKHPPLP